MHPRRLVGISRAGEWVTRIERPNKLTSGKYVKKRGGFQWCRSKKVFIIKPTYMGKIVITNKSNVGSGVA